MVPNASYSCNGHGHGVERERERDASTNLLCWWSLTIWRSRDDERTVFCPSKKNQKSNSIDESGHMCVSVCLYSFLEFNFFLDRGVCTATYCSSSTTHRRRQRMLSIGGMEWRDIALKIKKHIKKCNLFYYLESKIWTYMSFQKKSEHISHFFLLCWDRESMSCISTTFSIIY